MKRVKAALGVDLLAAIEGDLLERLANAPVLLCDVLWLLREPDARRRSDPARRPKARRTRRNEWPTRGGSSMWRRGAEQGGSGAEGRPPTGRPTGGDFEKRQLEVLEEIHDDLAAIVAMVVGRSPGTWTRRRSSCGTSWPPCSAT